VTDLGSSERCPKTGVPLANALTAHLEARSADYFEDLRGSPVSIRLASRRDHSRSVTYHFEVSGGGRVHPVVAKIARLPPQALPPAAGERPRMVQPYEPGEANRYQYAALAAVWAELGPRPDSRFGAVRPLDLLPELQAIVMEDVRLPTLRSLLSRERLTLGPARLDAAFVNAGALLRRLHGFRGGDPLPTLRGTRAEVLAAIGAFAEYLASHRLGARTLEAVTTAVESRAPLHMPSELLIGLGHGDFAARNVFVGPGARVTVVDLSARRRVPVYEDLAYFVTGLRTAKAQLLTAGRALPAARLERYERALLGGYFGAEPVPRGALMIYEILALLDRWTAHVARSRGLGGRAGVPQSLANRYFRLQAERLCARLAAE